jgi:hypothetical protein
VDVYSGKGTPRRKIKSKPKNSQADDRKLQAALKKLNTQPIQAIEEVNMFKSDGNVIHFAAPKGTYSLISTQYRHSLGRTISRQWLSRSWEKRSGRWLGFFAD